MTEIINPADFQKCVTIKTPGYSVMYALTNDNNLTYGDIISGLLHDALYIIKGDTSHCAENIFISHNDKIQYDLANKVIFKENKATVDITFDNNVCNYDYKSCVEM